MKNLIQIGLLFIFVSVAVSAPSLNIVSDSTWKSNGQLESGYTNPGFDDSGWSSTIIKSYPYPPQNWIPDTIARHMWHSDVSDLHVYMRKTFTLSNDVASAVVYLRGDDGFNFYVNGTLVDSYSSSPWGYLHTVDISSYLQQGENVFAVEAWDVITINRSMVVDARINIVPVPGSLVLGAIGTVLIKTASCKRKT